MDVVFDWQDLYSIAAITTRLCWLIRVMHRFHLTDPRVPSDKSGRIFNNPYQYF